MGRGQAERRDHRRDPRNACRLGDKRGGEADRVGDQQVSPLARRQVVLVGFPHGRQDHSPQDVLQAVAGVHHPPHHRGVVHEGRVGPHGPEAETQRLDLPAVAGAGDEDRFVSS